MVHVESTDSTPTVAAHAADAPAPTDPASVIGVTDATDHA